LLKAKLSIFLLTWVIISLKRNIITIVGRRLAEIREIEMEPMQPGSYNPYGDPAPNPYEQTIKADDYGLPPPPPLEKKRKRNVFVIAVATLVGVLLVGIIGIFIYRVSTGNSLKITPPVTSYTPPTMTTPTLPSMPSAVNTHTTIPNNHTCVLAIEGTSTSIELIGNDAITACNKVSTGVVFSQTQISTTPCANLQACTDTNPCYGEFY
jgi:hypothetical protein